MEKLEIQATVVSVITRIENSRELDQGSLTDWLVRLSHDGYRSAGFWSGEIIPPGRHQNVDWTMIQRFQTEETARAWQTSSSRKAILADFEKVTAVAGASGSTGASSSANASSSTSAKIIDEVTTDATIGSAVTAIVTNLKPAMEEDYWEWEYRIQAIQARFPGFGGVYVQPPPPGKPGQWTTLLRFDSPAALKHWFDAPVRQDLLAEANKFIADLRFHKLESSFPGWIPDYGMEGKGTPSWKGATMVVIGLFPILVLIKLFVAPLTTGLPPILAMALSTVLSVSTVSFLTMPILVKAFGWWLSPQKEKSLSGADLRGFLIALSIFAAEVVIALLIPQT